MLVSVEPSQVIPGGAPLASEDVLPGTRRLEMEGDLALQMVAGIDAFLTRELAASPQRRCGLWHQDFSSAAAYARSVEDKRKRFRKMIGVVDPRKAVAGLQLLGSTDRPFRIAQGNGFSVHAVRWPVFDGVDAEGLLLQPERKPVARIVALPDADQSPEQLIGLSRVAPETPAAGGFVQRLAQSGCQVIVPVLIDRQDTWLATQPYVDSGRIGFLRAVLWREDRSPRSDDPGRPLCPVDMLCRLQRVDRQEHFARAPCELHVHGRIRDA